MMLDGRSGCVREGDDGVALVRVRCKGLTMVEPGPESRSLEHSHSRVRFFG